MSRLVLTAVDHLCMMSAMTEYQIDPQEFYTTGQTAKFIGLSDRHVVRLVDDGHFPGSYRKSPVAKSPRQIPGSAIIAFLDKRKLD